MTHIHEDITTTIGNTPLVRLNRISMGLEATILAKIESFNPGSSIKDRVALSMIESAESNGLIQSDTILLEPTSGNTGIGLAMVAASRGYAITIVMPETMSIERQKILRAFGANLILTPGNEGMNGAISKAEDLFQKYPGKYYLMQQFKNPANPSAHQKTTAEEIWRDTDGNVDAVVASVGTGGTITGIAKKLKSYKESFKVIAVESDSSPVLSGGKPGSNKIQGIGAGFIPEILRIDLIDEVMRVKYDDAIKTSRQMAHMEGILCGMSSGATVWAALKIATKKEFFGKVIVVILPDTGERYLSTDLFQ